MDEVSFIVDFDLGQEVKGEGYYLNGHIVHIEYEEAKKIHGKKIRVSGKVIIEKGMSDTENLLQQGRYDESKHIKSPYIKILE